MNVDDAAREALEERRTKELHVPRADDELDAAALEPVRHREVAGIAIVVVVEREELHGDTSCGSSPERPHAGLVGRNRHNGESRVEQRLQVRSFAGDEDADHARTMVPITRASPGSGTTAT